MAKWKKNMTAEEKAAYAKIAKAKLDAAETMLKDGVKAVYNSTKWKEAMNYYASFHNYSLCNCLLIMIQKPEATRVASYADWKKKGRQVRKGETGITIRVPAPKKFKEVDEVTGEETEGVRMFYKTGSVFDVSQTDGDPLPEICRTLEGDVEDFAGIMETIRRVCPVPITVEKVDGGAYGYFSPKENRVVIREGIPERHAIKTAIHETAHAILHCKGGKEEKADQRTRELQAESVAYIVCQWLGLDTSEYSFEYVASWAADKSGKQLEKNLMVIGNTAKQIIAVFEGKEDAA